jgi:kumamolisin
MLDDGVTVISNSWSDCETQVTQADAQSLASLVQSAAVSGVSFFSAAGDSGSFCHAGPGVFVPNTTNFPSSAPYAIAVGGTTLDVTPANTYLSETWWGNWGNGTTDCLLPPRRGGDGCGGFGTSIFYSAPPWQQALGLRMRSVPDVAADADPRSGVLLFQADQGPPQPFQVGGTSMAAPIGAASTALLNQALGGPVGNLLPTLYSLQNSGAFHSPASMLPPNNDFQHLGLGSPRLGSLLAFLAGPSASFHAVVQAVNPSSRAVTFGPILLGPCPQPLVGCVQFTGNGAGGFSVTGSIQGLQPGMVLLLTVPTAAGGAVQTPCAPANANGQASCNATLPGTSVVPQAGATIAVALIPAGPTPVPPRPPVVAPPPILPPLPLPVPLPPPPPAPLLPPPILSPALAPAPPGLAVGAPEVPVIPETEPGWLLLAGLVATVSLSLLRRRI